MSYISYSNINEQKVMLRERLLDDDLVERTRGNGASDHKLHEGGDKEPEKKEEDKKEETWTPKNSYRARSSWCKRLRRGAMTKDEVIQELFGLMPRDKEEWELQHYYTATPRDEFIDLLKQLALISPKKDRLRIRIKQDLDGTEERHFHQTHQAIWITLDEYMIGRMDDSNVDRGNPESKPVYEKTEYVTLENLGDLLHFRQVAYDIFHLLDQDNDQLLRKTALTPAMKCEGGDIDEGFFDLLAARLEDPESEQAKTWLEQLDEAFNKDVNFHEFQKLLWTGYVELGLQVEELQHQIYREHTRCYAKWFLDIRSSKMRAKFAGEETVDVLGPIKNLVGDFLHVFDIYTDLYLAKLVYYFSRDDMAENGGEFTNDYNVCFVWICLTVFGPYLIQYSSYINQLYHKGVFQQQNFQKYNICTKLFLTFQMTAVGMLFIPAIDFVFKIQTLVRVLTLPCQARQKKGKPQTADINLKFQIWIEKTLNMNEFEILNFKQQSKFTQMIFEDVLMLVLDALIIFGFFNVPKITHRGLNGKTLLTQLGSSCVSIFTAYSTLAYQSKTLHEDKFEYILVCMKARQGWIPFGNILEGKRLFNNVDFGSTQLKKTGRLGTNAMGLYVPVSFKFSELTLRLFTKFITNASINKAQHKFDDETFLVEEDGVEDEQVGGSKYESVAGSVIDVERKAIVEKVAQYEPKFDFGKSLDALTAHSFLSFIAIQQQADADYLYYRFDLKKVDWRRLVQNSASYYKHLEVPGQPVSDFNQPLLQICIDNEVAPGASSREIRIWALRPLMIRLLKDYGCDPNVMDYFGEYTLLTYTFEHNKGQARDLLWRLSGDKIHLAAQNKDKSTNFGVCFKRHFNRRKEDMGSMNDEFAPWKLRTRAGVDIHAPQIMSDKGKLMTPLGYYLIAQYPSTTERMFFLNRSKEEEEREVDRWAACFGKEKSFNLGSEAEIDELLYRQQKLERERKEQGLDRPDEDEDGEDSSKTGQKESEGMKKIKKMHMYNKNNLPIWLQKTEVYEQLLAGHIKDPELQKYYEEKKGKNAGVKVVGGLMQQGLLARLATQKEDSLSKMLKADALKESQSNKAGKKNVNLCLLPVLLALFIEESSFFDFFSDFMIIIALGNSTDTAWFAFSLFTVLAPYYTVYTSLINNQIDRYRSQGSSGRSCLRYIGSLIMILPTMLVMLIVFDVVYMCISVVVYPVLLPFSFCSIGITLLEKYEDSQNYVLSKLFGLSCMEVQGFRSQRTILQFQLESIPQIFFQIYLIKRLEQLNRGRTSARLGVTSSAVEFSVLCAFVHVIFEIINLYVEARTSDTPFLQYVVTCYNSREKWMPRQLYFQSKSQTGGGSQEVIEIDEPGLFCGNRLGYRIGFKYTEPTMESLLQLISNMSFQKLGFRKTLMIDECFKDIELEKICSLGIVANKKLNLRCTDDYLEHLEHQMKTSKTLVQKLRNPLDGGDSSDDFLISKIIKSNNEQIAKLLVKVSADFTVKAKEDGRSLIRMAYELKKYDMLALMFKQKKKCRLEEQFKIDMQELRITGPGEFSLPADKEDRQSYIHMVSELFFDAKQLINSKDQFGHLEAMVGDMDFARNDQAETRFHAFWGAAGCPENQLEVIKSFQDALGRHRDKDAWNEKWDGFKDSLQKWQAKYPAQVTIKQKQNTAKISAAFLCKFLKFRQVFFRAFVHSPKGDKFPTAIDMADIDDIEFVDLYDIVDLQKVFDGTSPQIDLRLLQRFDMAVEFLGLDKERAQYFKKSRELLPAEDQAQAVQTYDVTSQGLSYQIPENIAAVRSLAVSKDLKRTLVSHVHSGIIQFEQTTVDVGVFKHLPSYAATEGKKDKRKIISMDCAHCAPKINRGQDGYTFYLTVESLLNDSTAGVRFQNFYQVMSDSFHSKVIKCKYELQFYKKVLDGKFC